MSKALKKILENLEGAGCATVVGVILLVLALIFGAFCLSGLIIWLLWSYVVLALFPQLPHFGFWMCVGISLLLSFIQGTIRKCFPSHNNDDD